MEKQKSQNNTKMQGKISTWFYILPYILGIFISWDNIYSARVLIICWGLTTIIYNWSWNKWC